MTSHIHFSGKKIRQSVSQILHIYVTKRKPRKLQIIEPLYIKINIRSLNKFYFEYNWHSPKPLEHFPQGLTNFPKFLFPSFLLFNIIVHNSLLCFVICTFTPLKCLQQGLKIIEKRTVLSIQNSNHSNGHFNGNETESVNS